LVEVHRRRLVRRRSNPPGPLRPLVLEGRLQPGSRAPCLARARVSCLPIYGSLADCGSRAYGLHLRLNALYLVAASPASPHLWNCSSRTAGNVPPLHQPFPLCLQPHRDHRTPSHLPDSPRPPRRLDSERTSLWALDPEPWTLGPRPSSPRHHSHQDHRHLPFPRNRLPGLGTRRLPSPRHHPPRDAPGRHRGDYVARVLLLLRAPLSRGLPLHLLRQRIHRLRACPTRHRGPQHFLRRPLDRPRPLLTLLHHDGSRDLLAATPLREPPRSRASALDCRLLYLPRLSQQPAAALLPGHRGPGHPHSLARYRLLRHHPHHSHFRYRRSPGHCHPRRNPYSWLRLPPHLHIRQRGA